MFKATILVDNIKANDLASEWGLSIYIEYNNKKYLLDTGGSNLYSKNAQKLGISIADVDTTVLSHAHYDHSGGLDSFFEENSRAKLYVSNCCAENCFFKLGPIRKYVGLRKGLLGEQQNRIVRNSGLNQIDDGVYLVPHVPNDLDRIGKKAHMYKLTDGKICPDNFDHEQSLVFETDRGLIVLNSCSHSGLQNIMRDIEHYLPNKNVYMTIGGMHLAATSGKNVKSVADTIKKLNIERVITGHCTGDRAYKILSRELGDKLQQMYTGLIIEV